MNIMEGLKRIRGKRAVFATLFAAVEQTPIIVVLFNFEGYSPGTLLGQLLKVSHSAEPW